MMPNSEEVAMASSAYQCVEHIKKSRAESRKLFLVVGAMYAMASPGFLSPNVSWWLYIASIFCIVFSTIHLFTDRKRKKRCDEAMIILERLYRRYGSSIETELGKKLRAEAPLSSLLEKDEKKSNKGYEHE